MEVYVEGLYFHEEREVTPKIFIWDSRCDNRFLLNSKDGYELLKKQMDYVGNHLQRSPPQENYLKRRYLNLEALER